MNLSEHFLKRKNDRWLREDHLREVRFAPLTEARDVGILFMEEEGGQQALNRWIEQLAAERKRVRAFTYFEKPHSNPYQFKFDFLTPKEISLFGEIRNEKASQFIDFRFDYLFCTAKHILLPFEYMLLRSQARCKVGFHQEGKEHLFDLMIEAAPETSYADLLKQMHEYTLKISESVKAV
ncbi:MAG: hypothetical protein MUD08_10650 [Cytophagales bacterium]|jgi:hypothetical protein|nr:hypothetical protein [Cytophagales bacterium]